MQAEAKRRAAHLGAPAAWALRRQPSTEETLQRLDPTGEGCLAQELDRVIAKAIALAYDPRLVPCPRPETPPAKTRR